MSVSDSVKKTVHFLSAVYEEQVIMSFIANINAILTGIIFFFMLVMGYPSLLSAALGGLFLLNSVWFVSNYLSTKKGMRLNNDG